MCIFVIVREYSFIGWLGGGGGVIVVVLGQYAIVLTHMIIIWIYVMCHVIWPNGRLAWRKLELVVCDERQVKSQTLKCLLTNESKKLLEVEVSFEVNHMLYNYSTMRPRVQDFWDCTCVREYTFILRTLPWRWLGGPRVRHLLKLFITFRPFPLSLRRPGGKGSHQE